MGVPILRGNININLKSLYKNHFMVNLCPIYIGSFIEPFVSGFCCFCCVPSGEIPFTSCPVVTLIPTWQVIVSLVI